MSRNCFKSVCGVRFYHPPLDKRKLPKKWRKQNRCKSVLLTWWRAKYFSLVEERINDQRKSFEALRQSLNKTAIKSNSRKTPKIPPKLLYIWIFGTLTKLNSRGKQLRWFVVQGLCKACHAVWSHYASISEWEQKLHWKWIAAVDWVQLVAWK